MVQHIGKEVVRAACYSGDFFQDGRRQLLPMLSKSQQSADIQPTCQDLLSPNTKPRHRAQNPGPTKGNGNHSLPMSNLRGKVSASASGSAISSAHYPKTMRSHHLSQLSLLHRRGAFPRLCELLEVKGSKASPSTYGCSCAPLAQSRKEDAEAGTAGRSSASDKYNKSRPSNQ